jgi:menaquinone reductase, multiheme cytochrome c subunit
MNANSSDKSSNKPSKGGWLFFLAGLVGALIVGWVVFPMALYSKQQQPMNFNHALHMDPERVFGIEGDTQAERCQHCHSFREDGSFVGIPKLANCMECHDDPNSPLGESPEEEHFLAEYVATGKEVPWLVYSRQPDCVYFDHLSHVKVAALDCKICHGPFGESSKTPVYEKNRISGYSRNIWGKNISGIKRNTWDSMKMDDCANCHTEMGQGQNNACFVCHK